MHPFICLFVMLAGLCSDVLATTEVIDVKSEHRRIRLLVESPATPIATIVLFSGGHGALAMDGHGRLRWGRGNFLLRSAPLFRQHHLVSVIIDAPSDRVGQGLYHFRDTAQHAQDVAAVIAMLRQRYALPVVLAGTSRGTESVVNAAVRLGQDGPNAIVLTASILEPNDGGKHLLAMNLSAIRVPTLIAHHRHDACKLTPYSGVDALRQRLTSAIDVTVHIYEGGTPSGKPCQARHYHGFNGIEADVTRDIALWLSTTKLVD